MFVLTMTSFFSLFLPLHQKFSNPVVYRLFLIRSMLNHSAKPAEWPKKDQACNVFCHRR